jgi:hypothetical protein
MSKLQTLRFILEQERERRDLEKTRPPAESKRVPRVSTDFSGRNRRDTYQYEEPSPASIIEGTFAPGYSELTNNVHRIDLKAGSLLFRGNYLSISGGQSRPEATAIFDSARSPPALFAKPAAVFVTFAGEAYVACEIPKGSRVPPKIMRDGARQAGLKPILLTTKKEKLGYSRKVAMLIAALHSIGKSTAKLGFGSIAIIPRGRAVVADPAKISGATDEIILANEFFIVLAMLYRMNMVSKADLASIVVAYRSKGPVNRAEMRRALQREPKAAANGVKVAMATKFVESSEKQKPRPVKERAVERILRYAKVLPG